MATTPSPKKPKTEPTKRAAAVKRRAPGKAAPARKGVAPKLKPKTVEKDSYESLMHKQLTAKEELFVAEYMVDLNATQAAIRAKYSEKSARQIGYEILSKPHIQAALANARAEQLQRIKLDADEVVMEAARVYFADARELVGMRVGSCRHCHGIDHKYQRTLTEMNEDREAWLDEGKPPEEFDEQGGIGYDARALPNSDCPDCAGAGYTRLILKDTRYLSPTAAALYAGAKEGKFGVEVLLHDKATFGEKLFKHLGLYEKDNEQKADALASLLHRVAKEGGNGFKPIADDPEAPPARTRMGQVQQLNELDDDEDEEESGKTPVRQG